MVDPPTEVAPPTVVGVSSDDAERVEFSLNGTEVSVPRSSSLLDSLREHLGVHSVKDGCSPQGQCGCCTVWIDGEPRVSCVTPVSRVSGRRVTTLEGLPDADQWAATFAEHGASQCGFCTPGIIMRCAALRERAGHAPPDAVSVEKALLAHLCRCTGWQPIVEAIAQGVSRVDEVRRAPLGVTDSTLAERRAALEGGVAQRVGTDIATGRGGFSDDSAPADALVAVRDANGSWVVGETLAEARSLSGKIQGRRTTAPPNWPIDVPPGEWHRTLQTTWVEPAYLEPDASWCEPGGQATPPNGNGGDFGAKATSEVALVARRLADEHGRAVRVLSTREDVVRYGPKRPPLALGVTADGSCSVRVARTAGIAEAIATYASFARTDLALAEQDVVGPATTSTIRGAGWSEVAIALTSLQPGPTYHCETPDGGRATAGFDGDELRITVDGGERLDGTVLRSYAIGAAHMAMGMVWSESISVDEHGVPLDLTIRSFGILRAIDLPSIVVDITDSDRAACPVSNAVFIAVATAAWAATGFAPRWPAPRQAT